MTSLLPSVLAITLYLIRPPVFAQTNPDPAWPIGQQNPRWLMANPRGTELHPWPLPQFYRDKIRQVLRAVIVDVDGWIDANGGPTASTMHKALVLNPGWNT